MPLTVSPPTVVWLGVALALACQDTTPVEPVITEWAGADFHLHVDGWVDGEMTEAMLDQDVVGDVAAYWCERNYEIPLMQGMPDYDRARLVRISAHGSVTVAGDQRLLILTIGAHDFSDTTDGMLSDVVPRLQTRPPDAGEVWLQWEWRPAPGSTQVIYAEAAQTGTFTLDLHTGTPDATGVILEDGAVGAHGSVRWSATEAASFSFTVACTSTTVVFIE